MTPFLTILEALAKEGPMNQYQLRKKTRLAKTTVERWISSLRAGRWIQVQRVERKRGPNPSEFYELTELGRYRIAASSPRRYLASKQRQLLGRTKYEAYVDREQSGRQHNAEHWSQLVKEALLARKATPGWHLALDIRANKAGRIRWKAKVGFLTS